MPRESSLHSLPARIGGLSVSNPCKLAADQYAASREITGPLVSLIKEQHTEYTYEVMTEQHQLKQEIKRTNNQTSLEDADSVDKILESDLKQARLFASEQNASSWLTDLPFTKGTSGMLSPCTMDVRGKKRKILLRQALNQQPFD